MATYHCAIQSESRSRLACPTGQGRHIPFQRQPGTAFLLWQGLATMAKARVRWFGPEDCPESSNYFLAPTAFIDDGLKFADGSTVKVYLALLCHRHRLSRLAWPSVARLASQANLSVRQGCPRVPG